MSALPNSIVKVMICISPLYFFGSVPAFTPMCGVKADDPLLSIKKGDGR